MGSVGGAVRRVVDGMTSELKVYFYACYDEADKQAYSGLTIGLCAASVREDVRKNFRHPKYISIHRVPELAVAVDGDGREYIIHKDGRADATASALRARREASALWAVAAKGGKATRSGAAKP